MAAVYICDGCGKPIDQPKKLGFVLPRDYCETCEKNALAFQDAIEAECYAVRQRFVDVRKNLIDAHGKDGFKLPDVPDGA